MGRILKAAAMGSSAALVGGGALAYKLLAARQTRPGIPDLSAAEFNRLSDAAAVARALASPAALKAARPVLYELPGCPYTARAKAVLDAHGVEYGTVTVDCVTLEEFDNSPYRCTPMLHLRGVGAPAGEGAPAEKPAAELSPAEAAARFPLLAVGPAVGGSDDIIRGLAAALGRGAEAADERVAQRCEWISEIAARRVFAASSSTLFRSLAYADVVTDERYKASVYLYTGAVVLTVVGRLMVAGRVRRDLAAEASPGVDAKTVSMDDALKLALAEFHDAAKRQTVADLAAASSGGGLFGRRQATPKEQVAFHGGTAPDLADIQLYGLLRANKGVAVTLAVRSASLDAWYEQMARHVPETPLVKAEAVV